MSSPFPYANPLEFLLVEVQVTGRQVGALATAPRACHGRRALCARINRIIQMASARTATEEEAYNLFIAARNGDAETLALMLERGVADLNPTDANNLTPLSVAVQRPAHHDHLLQHAKLSAFTATSRSPVEPKVQT